MTPSIPTPDAATAYRDLNRALLAFVLGVLVWKLGTYAVALETNRVFQTCKSLEWLGVPCPLCGMTRGFAALLRGDVQRAMGWNLLTLPMAALLLGELAYRGIGAGTRGAAALLRWRGTDRLFHQSIGVVLVLYALWFYARHAAAHFPFSLTLVPAA